MLRRLLPAAAGRQPLSARFVALAAATVACAACSSGTSGSDAPPADGTSSTAPEDAGAADGSGQGASTAAFTEAEVQELFDLRCVRCHGADNALLDLTAPFTKATVGVAAGTGRGSACAKSEHAVRIVAGDHRASLLWNKVKGTQDCGNVMPFDKGPERLTTREVERLAGYIDGLAR